MSRAEAVVRLVVNASYQGSASALPATAASENGFSRWNLLRREVSG
jgi:hypothetical protein